MLEKLDFTQIVRYFFSGCVAAFCFQIVQGEHPKGIYNLLCLMAWEVTTGYLTVFIISSTIIGYILFNFYRVVIYDLGVVSVKGILGKIKTFNTYREFIKYYWGRENGRQISSIRAEKLYIVIKATLSTGFYKDIAPTVATNLHFFYYASCLVFLSTLMKFCTLWPYSLISFGVFLITLFSDLYFEKTELLLFQLHRYYVMDAIRKIKLANY